MRKRPPRPCLPSVRLCSGGPHFPFRHTQNTPPEVDRFLNFASVRTRYACFGTRISSSNYVRSDRKFKKNRKFKIPVSNKRCTGQNISNYLVFFWTRYDFWSVWSRFSDFGSFSKTGAKPRVVKNREHPTKLVREAWAWFETTICFMWVLIVVNLDGFHGARYHQITTRSSEMH